MKSFFKTHDTRIQEYIYYLIHLAVFRPCSFHLRILTLIQFGVLETSQTPVKKHPKVNVFFLNYSLSVLLVIHKIVAY